MAPTVTSRTVVSYTAFPPLPCDFLQKSLRDSLLYRKAVYFCCTGLGVTSTGRYPASCPMKPGLSSPALLQPRSFVLLTHFCILAQYAYFFKPTPATLPKPALQVLYNSPKKNLRPDCKSNFPLPVPLYNPPDTIPYILLLLQYDTPKG